MTAISHDGPFTNDSPICNFVPRPTPVPLFRIMSRVPQTVLLFYTAPASIPKEIEPQLPTPIGFIPPSSFSFPSFLRSSRSIDSKKEPRTQKGKDATLPLSRLSSLQPFLLHNHHHPSHPLNPHLHAHAHPYPRRPHHHHHQHHHPHPYSQHHPPRPQNQRHHDPRSQIIHLHLPPSSPTPSSRIKHIKHIPQTPPNPHTNTLPQLQTHLLHPLHPARRQPLPSAVTKTTFRGFFLQCRIKFIRA